MESLLSNFRNAEQEGESLLLEGEVGTELLSVQAEVANQLALTAHDACKPAKMSFYSSAGGRAFKIEVEGYTLDHLREFIDKIIEAFKEFCKTRRIELRVTKARQLAAIA